MRTRHAPLLPPLMAVATVSVLLSTSGCTIVPPEFPPSGAHEPQVIAARGKAAAEQEKLLAMTAMGEPLSVSVQDYCQSGTYSEPWGPRDPFYWSCGHVTMWVVATDIADPAELIDAYRAHFTTIGCEPSGTAFDMTAQYWATYGVSGQNANGERYTVDDLPGASAQCSGGTGVGIGFRSAAGFDASTLVTYYPGDGERISDEPHDQAAVRASGSELIVTLSTSTTYHYTAREDSAPSTETTPEPQRCACFSGSRCDCPGG